MKMRLLVVVFLLFCYACVTTSKGDVTFSSSNFYNILRWDAASPRVPGEPVRYSVSYGIIDDGEFRKKPECQNITVQFCDLTDETPADHDNYYKAQVFLLDGSLHGTSGKFKPIADTVLGAPVLSYANGTSLHMDVMLPVGPKNEPIQEIFSRNHKGPSEATIVYILVITEPPWAAREIKNTSGHFDVSLNYKTKYCGYVVYTPVHEFGRPVSEKAHFCTTPQGDSWRVLPWLVLSVAVVAAVVLVAVCFAKRYSKDVKNYKMPLSLEYTIPPPQPMTYAQKDPNISRLEMPAGSEEIVCQYATIKFPPNVLSVGDGGYGHKNTIFVPWKEDSSMDSGGLHNPRSRILDDSGHSSEIYGAVTVNEENEEHQHQLNQTYRTNTLLAESEQLLSSVDISDKKEAQPLFLQTRKNSEGQLMLSFQVPQTFTATAEELVPCKRTPLLSYLIVSSDKGSNFVSLHSLESSECSDSGLDENTLPTPTQDCDLVSQYLTHFSPSPQSPVSCDSISPNSAYKPNWIPSFNEETYKTSYPLTWSGLKKECKEDD